jgi:alpha-D-xyloside xylohydrolase
MSEYFDRESIKAQAGFYALASVKPEQPIPGGMQFLTSNGLLNIYFYHPGVLRFQFETSEAIDYGLLIGQREDVTCEVQTQDNSVVLTADATECHITLSPFSFQILKNNKVILESINDCSMEGPTRFFAFAANEAHAWQVSFALKSGEPVYGLGEKFGRLNHRGELITNWNYDALGINAERSYKNNPFAWSPEGWGVFVHTPGRVKHSVGYSPWSHRSYLFQVEDTNLDFFVFTQTTPADIIDSYTNLTGKSPFLPEWSFGVWLARAYYYTAEELLDAVTNMREREIPLDVVLLDGRAWHKPSTRFDFSWDPERYPDPAGFVKQLSDLNVRLCLWEYPYISTLNPLFGELANCGFLLKTEQGNPYIHNWLPEPICCMYPQLSPSGIIDFTNPDAYDWFRDQHKALFEIGVAVLKTDFGESVPEHVVAYNGDRGKRLHNVYSLLYNRCVYEATKLYGQGDAMVWARSGWTGSQRFPLGWGGDPQSDWEGLAASIRGALSWGMSGVPFYAHDIGGWYGTLKDRELFVRWTQAGVLSSHTRFHGIGPREPWIFGPEIEHIIKKWIQFRYRLIPYIRHCEKEACRTGLPVMRAMPLAFPDDKASWAFEEQYLLGPSLLVAPITQQGGSVKIYLPHGNWYDLNTGEKFEGGRVILYEGVPLDKCPMFGREGGWLNLGPIVQHTGQLDGKARETEIWVFGVPDPEIGYKSENIELAEDGGNRKLLVAENIKLTNFT